MPDVVATGLLRSICTVQRPDNNAIDAGSPSGVYVPVIQNIPCMLAPVSILSIKATNLKMIDRGPGFQYGHLLLDTYYPQIPLAETQGWQVIIDGVTWDLLGVEDSSQLNETRLAVRIS